MRVQPASLRYLHVERVGDHPTGAPVRAPGRVAFRDGAISRVASPVTGRVVAVHVQVGEQVHEGDPLVEIDSADAAAARAQLAAAEAAEVAAQADVERQRSMASQGVGIASERQAAEARLAEAAADLARARATVHLVGGGASGRVVIRAAIDGTVLSREATVGAVASPDGGPLVQIGDPSALWLVADVFEGDLASVDEGAKADVVLPSVAEPVPAHVVRVGAAVEEETRRAPVYLAFDRSDVPLHAGMYATATIEGRAECAVTLPTQAVLVEEGGRTRVYVQRDRTTFVPREVTAGHPVDGRTCIVAGVAPGDRVVVDGALLLDNEAEELL